MAKSKAEYWLTDDGLLLIEAWARDGLSLEQIAKNCRVADSTFRIWKDKYVAISAAIKKNKEIADIEVENALRSKALSGDVAAMIFWLKNRKPKRWRDKPPEDNDDAMAAIRALMKSNEEAARAVQS